MSKHIREHAPTLPFIRDEDMSARSWRNFWRAPRVARVPGCTCSDQQLLLICCDCEQGDKSC